MKRNHLLFATLLPLGATIFVFYVAMLFIKFVVEPFWEWNDDDNNCCWPWCTIIVLFVIVLAITVPVGVVSGIKFASIPSACATMEECHSFCSIGNETFYRNLTYAQDGDGSATGNLTLNCMDMNMEPTTAT